MINQEMTYTEAKNYLLHCIDEAKSKDWADGIKFAIIIIEKAIEKKKETREVLDKIVAEIEDTGAYEQEVNGETEYVKGITYCLNIIDKYKAESEVLEYGSN